MLFKIHIILIRAILSFNRQVHCPRGCLPNFLLQQNFNTVSVVICPFVLHLFLPKYCMLQHLTFVEIEISQLAG